MVERKQRIFLYDRKEIVVLVLLGIMVAIFSFTFGVHLGKRVGPKPTHGNGVAETKPADTRADAVPNRQELTEQSKNVGQAAEETLNQSLRDEVERSKIRLETPRQVDLPKGTVSANAGGTSTGTATPRAVPATHAEPARPVHPAVDSRAIPDAASLQAVAQTIPALTRPSPAGRFTLQVGSHQDLEEARNQIDAIEAAGIRPFMRAVELKNKGKWYRLYVGGFDSKQEAERVGLRYRSEHVIDSFIVAKMAD